MNEHKELESNIEIDDEELRNEYPDWYCPLSHQLMKEPCLLNDEVSYEYDFINEYLNLENNKPKKSPINPAIILDPKCLTRNKSLENTIEGHLNKYPKYKKLQYARPILEELKVLIFRNTEAGNLKQFIEKHKEEIAHFDDKVIENLLFSLYKSSLTQVDKTGTKIELTLNDLSNRYSVVQALLTILGKKAFKFLSTYTLMERTCLQHAVRFANLDTIKLIIQILGDHAPQQIIKKTPKLGSCLKIALYFRDATIVKYLLEIAGENGKQELKNFNLLANMHSNEDFINIFNLLYTLIPLQVAQDAREIAMMTNQTAAQMSAPKSNPPSQPHPTTQQPPMQIRSPSMPMPTQPPMQSSTPLPTSSQPNMSQIIQSAATELRAHTRPISAPINHNSSSAENTIYAVLSNTNFPYRAPPTTPINTPPTQRSNQADHSSFGVVSHNYNYGPSYQNPQPVNYPTYAFASDNSRNNNNNNNNSQSQGSRYPQSNSFPYHYSIFAPPNQTGSTHFPPYNNNNNNTESHNHPYPFPDNEDSYDGGPYKQARQ